MPASARLGALAALCLTTACAHPAPPPLLSRSLRPALPVPAARAMPPPRRAAVVHQARELLAGAPLVVRGLSFPRDPVGFVRAAYWAAGIDLFAREVAADERAGGVEIAYRSAALRRSLHAGTPRPGDLAFFDGAARETDLYPAQMAVVEQVRGDGTVVVIGLFGGKAARVAMNLRTPERARDESDRPVNDTLAGEQTALASQLFRSFANPFGD